MTTIARIAGRVGIALAGIAVTTATTLGVGVSTANASPTPAGLGCNNYHYISADAVRVRKTAGGTILGLSWYGTRVLLGKKSGAWQQVTFPRPEEINIRSGGTARITSGWVSARYVGYFNQQTDLCPY